MDMKAIYTKPLTDIVMLNVEAVLEGLTPRSNPYGTADGNSGFFDDESNKGGNDSFFDK